MERRLHVIDEDEQLEEREQADKGWTPNLVSSHLTELETNAEIPALAFLLHHSRPHTTPSPSHILMEVGRKRPHTDNDVHPIAAKKRALTGASGSPVNGDNENDDDPFGEKLEVVVF